MARLNKKGSLDDLVYIMGIILVFAIAVVIVYKFVSEFNTGVKGLDPNLKGINESKAAVQSIENIFPQVLDGSFLFLTIGLCIAALIMAMLVRIHPVFFVFYFILIAIVIFAAGVFSNIYAEVAENSQMIDVASKLIFTSHILRYLPIVIGVLGFALAIVMYRNYQAG